MFKERITVEQLRELTLEQQDLLRQWWEPRVYDVFYFQLHDYVYVFNGMIEDYDPWDEMYGNSLPLLTIGQMIHMIQQRRYCFYLDEYSRDEDLCDQLWETMKSLLEAELKINQFFEEVKPVTMGRQAITHKCK